MAAFAIPLIGAALGGLGGLFGNKDKVTTNTTTPNLSDAQKRIAGAFTSQATNGNTQDDLSAYRAQGMQTINDSFAPQDKAIDNNIASRGLSFSPIAAALKSQSSNSRIAQQNQFQNQLPLLKRQWDQQQFQNLLQSFQTLPTATTSTSTQPQSQIGGAISGLGSGLFAGLSAVKPKGF